MIGNAEDEEKKELTREKHLKVSDFVENLM